MKTVQIIMAINNHDMLNDGDLESYQTADCHFKISYPDTHLKELTNMEEVNEVMPSVMANIKQAAKEKASVMIIFAFGDFILKETQDLVAVPVMGLGRVAIPVASALCRNFYTVIPSLINSNDFIQPMVKGLHAEHNFILTEAAVGLGPAELKGNPVVLKRLIEIASLMIEKHNVDTFTLGCGGFIGVANQLENELRKLHHKPITVVDPVATAFRVAMTFS